MYYDLVVKAEGDIKVVRTQSIKRNGDAQEIMPFLQEPGSAILMVPVFIPTPLLDGLAHYIRERRPVGGFLTALLECNFKEIMARADDRSIRVLDLLFNLLYNEFPSYAWGSKEKVKQWIQADGDTWLRYWKPSEEYGTLSIDRERERRERNAEMETETEVYREA